MKHIDRSQLEKLTETLRRREEELKTDLEDILHHVNGTGDLSFANYTDTTDDGASATALADHDLAIARHDLLELYEVQEAIKRIEQKSYGICAHCGKDIPVARLLAQPSALFCTPCLSTLEKICGLEFRPTT